MTNHNYQEKNNKENESNTKIFNVVQLGKITQPTSTGEAIRGALYMNQWRTLQSFEQEIAEQLELSLSFNSHNHTLESPS